jgi:hyaluronan synthase
VQLDRGHHRARDALAGAAIGLVSTFYMLYYLRSERSWDFLYGILYGYFSFFALSWIFPYAVVTVRARGWLTR